MQCNYLFLQFKIKILTLFFGTNAVIFSNFSITRRFNNNNKFIRTLKFPTTICKYSRPY